MAGEVERARASGEEGVEAVDKVASSIARVASDAEKSAGEVRNLGDRAREIQGFVSQIGGIADQTNLLALNAAIEAARAGEHGKGFAVVADEVRKLAEKSAGSAKEIEALIKDSLGKVEAGVGISKTVEENLQKMVTDVSSVSAQVQLISNATNEQAVSMEENASITESNAAAAEELASASEELAAHAESLRQLVSSFKIDQRMASALRKDAQAQEAAHAAASRTQKKDRHADKPVKFAK